MNLDSKHRNAPLPGAPLRARVAPFVVALLVSVLSLWALLSTLGRAAPPRQTAYPPVVVIDRPGVGQVLTTSHTPYLVQGGVRPGTLGPGPIVALSLTLDGGLSYTPVVTAPYTQTLPLFTAWSYTWALPADTDWSSTTLQARARDADDVVGTSDPVTVWVDTAPPASLFITANPPFVGDGQPLPSHILLAWGADDAAGVVAYDIQYRVDDSPWTAWLVRTAESDKAFGLGGDPESLEWGHTYFFRQRAYDGVGNVSNYVVASARIGHHYLYIPLTARNFYQDTYEPNDTFAQAYGPLEPGVDYWSYIWSAGDRFDYYYIEMNQPQRVLIDLGNIVTGTDYDLYLYDENQSLVAASNYAGVPSEHIDYSATLPGHYYILVYAYIGFNNVEPYSLRVTYP